MGLLPKTETSLAKLLHDLLPSQPLYSQAKKDSKEMDCGGIGSHWILSLPCISNQDERENRYLRHLKLNAIDKTMMKLYWGYWGRRVASASVTHPPLTIILNN